MYGSSHGDRSPSSCWCLAGALAICCDCVTREDTVPNSVPWTAQQPEPSRSLTINALSGKSENTRSVLSEHLCLGSVGSTKAGTFGSRRGDESAIMSFGKNKNQTNTKSRPLPPPLFLFQAHSGITKTLIKHSMGSGLFYEGLMQSRLALNLGSSCLSQLNAGITRVYRYLKGSGHSWSLMISPEHTSSPR